MVRAWWQGTARAAGTAVLAPAAIVAAAGVIALGGGGLGGLGSLSQLVNGPSLPESSARSSAEARAGAPTTPLRVPLLAALPPSPGSSGTGGGAGRGGTGPHRYGRRRHRAEVGPRLRGRREPDRQRAGGWPSGRRLRRGERVGRRRHAPAAPPAPLTQVGSAVKQIAAPLPEPVRTTIDQLADTVTGATGRGLIGG